MYPWQQEMLKKMSGFKKGELMVMSAGRNVGKSAFSAQAIERLMRDLNNRPIENLVMSESKVHGARYYCVEPVGGNWLEMEKWAVATYGLPGEIWPLKESDPYGWPECSRWYANNRKFWFRNEADRTMFVLKWR
jgi:hypothetical protein